jgi:hypothetical protein
MHKIAFNTANLVGRTTHYQFSLNNCMEHDRLTTDANEFNAELWRIAPPKR